MALAADVAPWSHALVHQIVKIYWLALNKKVAGECVAHCELAVLAVFDHKLSTTQVTGQHDVIA